MQDISDEELDRFILTRLRILGVDLDVLPPEDPLAPADQRRVLSSARSFLRSTPAVIHGLDLGMEGSPPEVYPVAGGNRARGEGGS